MTRLLTLVEAAEFLRIAPRTLYNERYERREPGSLGIRVGGRVRFRLSDLDSYLDQRSEKPS